MTLRLTDLSRRRQQVAELVGDGLTYREMALALGISAETVRVHVSEIADKIGRDGNRPYVQVMRWVLEQRKAA